MAARRYLHPDKRDAVSRVLLKGKARKTVTRKPKTPAPSQDLVVALAQQMLQKHASNRRR